MKIFGREPAVVIAFIATILQVAASLGLNLSTDLQGAIIAVLAALAGAVTAWKVAADKALPLLLGLAQAGFALLLALHFDVKPDVQSAVAATITAAFALFVRTQVVAPVAKG
jgi:heme/copper-type cytochrome/quinol oxidase subunit 4